MVIFKKEPVKRTVEQVLTSFNEVVAELEGIALDKSDVVSKNEEEIRRLEAASDAAGLEAERARSVASKIKALVS